MVEAYQVRCEAVLHEVGRLSQVQLHPPMGIAGPFQEEGRERTEGRKGKEDGHGHERRVLFHLSQLHLEDLVAKREEELLLGLALALRLVGDLQTFLGAVSGERLRTYRLTAC